MPTSQISPAGRCSKCAAVIPGNHSYTWCHKCGEPLAADILACLPHVQATAALSEPSAPSQAVQRVSYPALRAIAGFYRIMAYVVLVVGLLFVLVALQGNALAAIGAGLYAAFVFLLLLAGGELLRVVPDIADHAERTNELLREIKADLSKKT